MRKNRVKIKDKLITSANHSFEVIPESQERNYLLSGGLPEYDGTAASWYIEEGSARINQQEVVWPRTYFSISFNVDVTRHRAVVISINENAQLEISYGTLVLKSAQDPAFPTLGNTRLGVAVVYDDVDFLSAHPNSIFALEAENEHPNRILTPVTGAYGLGELPVGRYYFNNLIITDGVTLTDVNPKYNAFRWDLVCAGNCYIHGDVVEEITGELTFDITDGKYGGSPDLSFGTSQKPGGAVGYQLHSDLKNFHSGFGAPGMNINLAINSGGFGAGGGASIHAEGGDGGDPGGTPTITAAKSSSRAFGAGFLYIKSKNLFLLNCLVDLKGYDGLYVSQREKHPTNPIYRYYGGNGGGGGGRFFINVENLLYIRSSIIDLRGGKGADATYLNGTVVHNSPDIAYGGGGGGGGGGGLFACHYLMLIFESASSMLVNGGLGGTRTLLTGTGTLYHGQDGYPGEDGQLIFSKKDDLTKQNFNFNIFEEV